MMKRSWSRKNLWEQMPGRVKATAGRLLGLLPPHVPLGRQFARNLAFANQAQWWDADRVAAYQFDHLKQICSWAWERSGYYRRTLGEVGFEPGDLKSADDLRGLPTIDKHTLRRHLDEMCATDPSGPGIDYVATGGSSGEPLRFYIGSDRSAIEYAYLVASWQRAGYDLRTPQAVFRGQIVEPNREGLRHEYDPILRRHCYSNFHMNDESMGRYMAHVSRIGPCYLHVYPSSASALARFLRRTKTPAPGNIRGILAGSENVYENERQLVREVFGVRYFSWYGHSEKLVLAAECEQSEDYHVWPTYGYCELLDEQGLRVTKPGQRGEIVGTGFINRVIPFIRYRTGDYATYVGARCGSCGREQVILRDIEGRWPQGNLTASDGSVISLTALNVHDDTFEGILDYQFRQERPGEACLRVVPARALSADEQARIVSRMTSRLQGQITLTLEVCEALQKTSRGKLSRVITGNGRTEPREETVEASRSEL